MLRPPPISRVGPTLNALVDAAAEAGANHVVFSSVAGAESNRIVPHHRVESHLRKSSLGWTILRPGFFAQNFGDAYRRDIVEDGRIYVPAAEGRVAFVDVRDLADTAAIVFTDPDRHRGAGYKLTGPAAVTFDEAASTLSAELGREVRYEAATSLGYMKHLRGRGLPPAQIAVQTLLHLGLRRGDASEVDPTADSLLGRRPRSLAEYFSDHHDAWRIEGD